MPEAKAYGFRAKGKARFLSGVITPAQPHYLYGLLDANVDPPLGRAPPILGIAASAGGYQVSSLFWLIQSLTCGKCVSGLPYIMTTLLSVMLLAGAQTAKHLRLAGALVLLSIVFHLVALGCCLCLQVLKSFRLAGDGGAGGCAPLHCHGGSHRGRCVCQALPRCPLLPHEYARQAVLAALEQQHENITG